MEAGRSLQELSLGIRGVILSKDGASPIIFNGEYGERKSPDGEFNLGS